MMEENKKGANTLYAVIGIATLVVAIIGATFAFFSTQTGSENNAVNVGAYEFATSVKSVDRIYPTTTDEAKFTQGIIPLNAATSVGDTTYLMRALSADKKCIDDKGYMVCVLYKVTLTNTSTIAAEMNLTVKTIKNVAGAGGSKFTDLTFQALNGNEEAFTLNSTAVTLLAEEGQSNDVNGVTITADPAETTGVAKETVHYFVVYLNEASAESNQSTQMGAKYEGQLIYTTTTGGNTLTGTFQA
jgi:hypothetical protein